jgi:hypothetical protein
MSRVVDTSESQVETPLAKRADTPPQAAEPSIGMILQYAIEKGHAPEAIEKLAAVFERMQDRRAAQAFALAMSGFRADCPPIPRKTENAQFMVTIAGNKRPRRYASLDDIAATIREPLSKHGLSFRWSEGKIADGFLSVTCVVTHIDGHKESSAVTVPIDSKAGCSDQQKMGTANTYAQRYSIIQALGLTSCDDDDDGNGPKDLIDDNQAANIRHLIDETKADKVKLLATVGVETIEAIPAAAFRMVVNMLESKRKAQGAKA